MAASNIGGEADAHAAARSRSIATLTACVWMVLFFTIHFPACATDDVGAIRALIGATWDQPDSKVETELRYLQAQPGAQAGLGF